MFRQQPVVIDDKNPAMIAIRLLDQLGQGRNHIGHINRGHKKGFGTQLRGLDPEFEIILSSKHNQAPALLR